MSRSVTVEVPDELFEYLTEKANAAGTTPGQWISKNLGQIVRKPDERLWRHFGSISLGRPIFKSNEELDKALSEDYGSAHDEAVRCCSILLAFSTCFIVTRTFT